MKAESESGPNFGIGSESAAGLEGRLSLVVRRPVEQGLASEKTSVAATESTVLEVMGPEDPAALPLNSPSTLLDGTPLAALTVMNLLPGIPQFYSASFGSPPTTTTDEFSHEHVWTPRKICITCLERRSGTLCWWTSLLSVCLRRLLHSRVYAIEITRMKLSRFRNRKRNPSKKWNIERTLFY